MYRVAHIQVFDFMDQVHVSSTIRTYELGEGAEMHNDLESVTCTVQGTGETDPHRWLADALVALIEAL